MLLGNRIDILSYSTCVSDPNRSVLVSAPSTVRMFKFLLLLAIFPAILCFYDAEKNITVLTDSTFKSLVKGEIWAINFYSKIIPECREFAKEYIKSANALNGLIKFGAVDIDRSKTLTEKYRVNDVPHLIFVGLRNGKTLVYTGPKTVQYLVEEILDTMRGKVRENLDKGIKFTEELDGNKLEDVQLGSDKDWLVYFHAPWCTECQKMKFIWEEVINLFVVLINI